MDMTKIIGTNVKNNRKKLGFSQKDLAVRAEITQAALCYIERGERNPSISTLELLAVTLGLSVSALVSIKCEENP